MIRNAKLLPMTILLLAADCSLGLGQQPLSILTIDVQNVVEYQGDVSDPTKFGINPGVTPSGEVKEFGVNVVFGDIVAVNGQPAKGTYVGRPLSILLTPTPKPGQAIADVSRGS